jgi:outer membrane protein TolC
LRTQLGSGAELAELQAKVDRNADYSELLSQRAALVRAKADLNVLMARNPEIDFEVSPAINLREIGEYAILLTKLETENKQLLAARSAVRVSEYELKEAKTAYSPQIDLFGQYNFGRSVNEVGILQSNRSFGPTYGIVARFNLFSGFNRHREVQNRKLEMLSSQSGYDAQVLAMRALLYSAYTSYLNNSELVALERENLKVAEKAVDVALESYRLGGANDPEVREAQLQYIEAESRLLNAEFQAKAAEIELFRLTGGLEAGGQPAE